MNMSSIPMLWKFLNSRCLEVRVLSYPGGISIFNLNVPFKVSTFKFMLQWSKNMTIAERSWLHGGWEELPIGTRQWFWLLIKHSEDKNYLVSCTKIFTIVNSPCLIIWIVSPQLQWSWTIPFVSDCRSWFHEVDEQMSCPIPEHRSVDHSTLTRSPKTSSVVVVMFITRHGCSLWLFCDEPTFLYMGLFGTENHLWIKCKLYGHAAVRFKLCSTISSLCTQHAETLQYYNFSWTISYVDPYEIPSNWAISRSFTRLLSRMRLSTKVMLASVT